MTTSSTPVVARLSGHLVETFAVEGLRPGLDVSLKAKQAVGLDAGHPRGDSSGLVVRRITSRPTGATSAIVVVESDWRSISERPLA